MFSGLIAYTGRVKALQNVGNGGARLLVICEGIAQEHPEPKDSIAVNGVCLTATSIAGETIAFDVVPETLSRSTLGSLREGDSVNLEYSLRLGDRIGGHFVYGHIDATARILTRAPEGQGIRLRIERPGSLAHMLVEKAFVSVDGVSVTIARTPASPRTSTSAGTHTSSESSAKAESSAADWFEIALIPETLERTTLGFRNAGDDVNIEVDPIARYAQASRDTQAPFMSSRAERAEGARSRGTAETL